MRLESITKIIILIATLLAELTHAALATQRPLLGLCVSGTAFVGTLLIARRFPSLTLAAVLTTVYILRGLFYLMFQHLSFYHFLPVSSCLLGIVLTRPNLQTWDLPQQWKFPLVLWGLIIALSWPIVFLRELDFAPLLTAGIPPPQTVSGIPIRFAALWVAHAAMIQGLGILWLDWLFRTFRTRPRVRFERDVLMPLAVGFLITSLVAFYQGFIDIKFLNTENWFFLGRASGALLDGNALGTLAAVWGPALLVLILSRRRRGYLVLAPIALAASWLCMLLSGSTSALMIAGLTGGSLLWLAYKTVRTAEKKYWITWSLVSICGVGLFFWVLSSPPVFVVHGAKSPAQTSLHRLLAQLPPPSEWSPATIIKAQLRDRPFFAHLALQMAAEAPWVGIGVGSFHTLAHHYIRKYKGDDPHIYACALNCCALNWYLKQLAELGILGSLAWGTWIVVLIRSLLSMSSFSPVGMLVVPLQVSLIGFGFASLLNIPAESPEILLTFWTFVFWLSTYIPQLSESAEREKNHQTQYPARWALLVGLAVLYVTIQGYTSVKTLNVSHRTVVVDRDYEYGFHDRRHSPDFLISS